MIPKKSRKIFRSLSGQDSADVRLHQETGTAWNNPAKGQDWKARTEHLKGHWKVRRAHNEQDNTSHPIQFGGVLTSTSGRAVSWIMEEGSDPSGLGRWSWQRLGLQGHGSTILISAHAPCDNPGEGFTVWDQHKRAFGGNPENPRTKS